MLSKCLHEDLAGVSGGIALRMQTEHRDGRTSSTCVESDLAVGAVAAAADLLIRQRGLQAARLQDQRQGRDRLAQALQATVRSTQSVHTSSDRTWADTHAGGNFECATTHRADTRPAAPSDILEAAQLGHAMSPRIHNS